MQLPGSQRREVIEDILDIRVFSTMNTLLKQRMQETKDEIIRTESALNLARERVDNQQKTIKILLESRKDAVSAIQKKISDNEEQIVTTNETIGVLNQDIGPANLPPDVVKKLNDVVTQSMNNKNVSDRLAKIGAEPKTMTPSAFGTYISTESARWGNLIRTANIKLD
jgi:hypothetical protein